MQKANSSSDESSSHKNTYVYMIDKQRSITIDSNFDNGNINMIKPISEFHYRLEAVSDTKSTSNSSKKSWFSFKVTSSKGIRIKFSIQNVSIYENMYEDKNWPKPFVKDDKTWKQVKDAFLSYRDEIVLIFDYTFTTHNPVHFCMTIPFTYEQSEFYLEDLKYRIPEQILYQDKILTKSYGKLNTHMLKITAKQNNQAIYQKKPIVLLTCRVHPGQVGSTYCLMGVIDFLLRVYNVQSKLLTKMFQFIIFPLVNPDGVYEGNYRMDSNNINLNRVYNDPSPEFHPTVSKIKAQINQIIKNRKILFHFDLHSHSALKSAFIYGNAYESIVSQTQSQLFCKLLQQNSEIFKYSLSRFDERHMKMKDKGENMSKQGCARVVLSKLAGITFSYTVETSIFPYVNRQPLIPPKNQDFKFHEYQFQHVCSQNITSRHGPKHPLIIDNMLLGQNILITILDMIEKNPYPRILEPLQNYRKQISQQLLQNEERFKLLDIKAHQKTKMISKFIHEEFISKYAKYWQYLGSQKQYVGVIWPNGFKWFPFIAILDEKKKDKIRTKTQTTHQSRRQIDQFLNPKNVRKNMYQINRDYSSKLFKTGESPQSYPNVVSCNLQIPEIVKGSIQKSEGINSLRATKPNKKLKKESKNLVLQQSCHIPSIQIKQLQEIQDLKQKQLASIKQNIVFQYHEQGQIKKDAQDQSLNLVPKNQFPIFPNRFNNHKAIKKISKSSKIIENIAINNRTSLNNNIINLKHQNTCEEIVAKRKITTIDDYNIQTVRFSGEKRDHVNPKRELVRVKFSEIKKKNLIRQDVKLPQLKLKGNLCVYNSAENNLTPNQY